eukprot:2384704-Amphidinium_carterae.2
MGMRTFQWFLCCGNLCDPSTGTEHRRIDAGFMGALRGTVLYPFVTAPSLASTEFRSRRITSHLRITSVSKSLGCRDMQASLPLAVGLWLAATHHVCWIGAESLHLSAPMLEWLSMVSADCQKESGEEAWALWHFFGQTLWHYAMSASTSWGVVVHVSQRIEALGTQCSCLGECQQREMGCSTSQPADDMLIMKSLSQLRVSPSKLLPGEVGCTEVIHEAGGLEAGDGIHQGMPQWQADSRCHR